MTEATYTGPTNVDDYLRWVYGPDETRPSQTIIHTHGYGWAEAAECFRCGSGSLTYFLIDEGYSMETRCIRCELCGLSLQSADFYGGP